MKAERETADRLIAHFLADRIGASFQGRISGVTRAGLFVKLSDTGADGFIPIRTLGTEYFNYDEARHALVGTRSGAMHRLGDVVDVRLVEAAPIASIASNQARFPSEQVTIVGRATAWMRTAESGNALTFHFCPTCGSTVYWENEGFPGYVAVAIGNFADPNFLAPTIAVWEESRHSWFSLPPNTPPSAWRSRGDSTTDGLSLTSAGCPLILQYSPLKQPSRLGSPVPKRSLREGRTRSQ